MGRKIPGRKHKGVKDPLIQKAVREHKLKMKINAPPSNPDEQEIPKSLQNVIRLKQMALDKNFVRKKKTRGRSKLVNISTLTRKEFRLPVMKRADKPLPNLSQWQGETEEKFLKRIDEATQSLINEVEFEQQFGVQVKRNPETGHVEQVEMVKVDDEINYNFMKRRKKNQTKAKGFIRSYSEESNFVGKLEKKRAENFPSDEKSTDIVKFGEVVHSPPVITVRPKGAAHNSINQMVVKGSKRHLLLEEMFHGIDNKNKSKNKTNSVQ